MLDLDLTIERAGLSVRARVLLPARGITAFIGHSGAGKSTLLMALAGLLRPANGHARLNDAVLFDAARGIDLPPPQRALGLVFQDGRLFPHMNVRANLLYGAHRASHRPGPGLDDVVSLLGIEPLLARRPHSLSGGERQRVAIGRALLARPRALLMDEPLASLDPPRRQELLDYLAELPHRYGLPVLYVTHQMDEVLRLADQVVVMSEGRTLASGDALDVLSDVALQPMIGRFESGSVLAGTVVEHLAAWQLSAVQVAGQRITVPHIAAAVGAQVRLRIRARDVALQREVLPSSASNQLGGTVLRVMERDGPYAVVELALSRQAPAGERLAALVTRRSVQALSIAVGQPWVGSFKAVAVEGRSTALHAAP